MHAYIFEDCPFSVVLCKIGRYSATSFYRPALVLSQGAPFEQYCRILGYLATVLGFPPHWASLIQEKTFMNTSTIPVPEYQYICSPISIFI